MQFTPDIKKFKKLSLHLRKLYKKAAGKRAVYWRGCKRYERKFYKSSRRIILKSVKAGKSAAVKYVGRSRKFKFKFKRPVLPPIPHLNWKMKTLVGFTVVASMILLSPMAQAVWNGTFYNPGDTLNPECAPTDVDCDVLPPLTSSSISDTIYGVSWDADITHAPTKNAVYDKIEALAASNHAAVTLGTANGLSLSSQELSLGLASAVATGALSSADWNTFNNKADALGADDNYVTDAEKIVIGNTSGTNTGDQTSIVGITGTLAQFNTAVTDADLARTDAAQTFTGIQTFSGSVLSDTFKFASATTTGMRWGNTGGGGTVTFDVGGNVVAGIDSNNLEFIVSKGIVWTNSSSDISSTKDTGLSRVSAGVVGVGTGAAGSVAGTVSAANYISSGTVTGIPGMVTAGLALYNSGQLYGTGGDVYIKGQADNTNFATGQGEVLISGGNVGGYQGTYVDGGNVKIIGGNAANDGYLGNTNPGNGGDIYVYGGTKVNAGSDGDIILAHNGTSAIGNVGVGISAPISGSKLTLAGDFYFSAGNRTLKVYDGTGVASTLTIMAGDAGEGNNGGDLNLTGGAGDGSGGDVKIYGGSGVAGGDVILAHTGSAPIGNVGIGETAPDATLYVKGSTAGTTVLTLKEPASQTTQAFKIYNSSGALKAYWGTTNNSDYYLNAGYAVIATEYQSASTNFKLNNNGLTLASSKGLFFTVSGNADQTVDTGLSRVSAGVVGVGTGAAGSTAGTMQLTSLIASGEIYSTKNGSGALLIRVSGQPVVGMGRNSTVGGMNMYGGATTPSDSNPDLLLITNNLKAISGLVINWSSSNVTQAADAGLSRVSAGVVGVGTGAAGSTAGTLVAGSIGVGDTTPDGLLDVEPTGATTANSYGINLSNLATNSTTDGINKYGMYVTSTGAFAGSAGAGTYNYGLYVDTISGADNNYGAYFNGNVGIANATPSVALDVTGDIEYTGTITDVSDKRLKVNIEDFSGALDIISSLDAKTYMMKNGDKTEIGFIAQEVQEILPSVVSVIDPDKGYLGMSYVSLVPVVSEAVKELNLKLESVAVPLQIENQKTFTERFFARIAAWLGEATNGIRSLRTAEEICINNTCITEAQLIEILNDNNTSSGGGSSTPAPEPEPEPAPEPLGSSTTGDAEPSTETPDGSTPETPAEPVTETTTEPAPESTPTEPATASAPEEQITEPAPEPTSEPEPAPEPVPEPAPEPVASPEPSA